MDGLLLSLCVTDDGQGPKRLEVFIILKKAREFGISLNRLLDVYYVHVLNLCTYLGR